MAQHISARFYQSATGAPIQASLIATYTTMTEWNNEVAESFGVMTTSVAPTDKTDFGGHFLAQESGDVTYRTWEALYAYGPGDAQHANCKCRVVLRAVIPVDGTWAAGRYVFAYSEGPDDSLLQVAAPYRIR